MRLKLSLLALVVAMLSALAPAAPASAQSVVSVGSLELDEAQRLGTYDAAKDVTETRQVSKVLVDSEGQTLYIIDMELNGLGGRDVCYNMPFYDCEVDFPPVIVSPNDQLTTTDEFGGVLGTFIRRDGSTQLTYNGWPLHTTRFDTVPGQVAQGGFFYQLGVFSEHSAGGAPIPVPQPEPTPEPEPQPEPTPEPAPAPVADVSDTREGQRIIAQSERFDDLFERNRGRVLQRFYQRNGGLELPGAEAVFGRRNIRQAWDQAFNEGGLRAVDLTITSINATDDPRVFVEHGNYELTVETPNGMITVESTYEVEWFVPRNRFARPKIIFDLIRG